MAFGGGLGIFFILLCVVILFIRARFFGETDPDQEAAKDQQVLGKPSLQRAPADYGKDNIGIRLFLLLFAISFLGLGVGLFVLIFCRL